MNNESVGVLNSIEFLNAFNSIEYLNAFRNDMIVRREILLLSDFLCGVLTNKTKRLHH